MIKDGLSIIICTYNGAALLPATLRHIARQEVPADLAWEVIVVDNASTDRSAEVARTEWSAHACRAPLRVLQQLRPGLNAAREMGFAESRYKYVVMCDDDNWLASNYVATAYAIMELHPAIGMLGGQGTLAYETHPPDWAVAYPIHAGGPQAPTTGNVPGHGLYGAGSVMRKAAYLAIRQAGFQFLLTDRLGNQLSSGGDFELCHGIAMANYLIWYDERLRLTHFITSKRISWSYYVNYLNTNALSFNVLEPYKIFLDTNSGSVLTFGITLIKNFLYYTASLLYNGLKINGKALSETDKKVTTLKIIALKARLRSYRHVIEMGRNFLAAKEFKKRYIRMLNSE